MEAMVFFVKKGEKAFVAAAWLFLCLLAFGLLLVFSYAGYGIGSEAGAIMGTFFGCVVIGALVFP